MALTLNIKLLLHNKFILDTKKAVLDILRAAFLYNFIGFKCVDELNHTTHEVCVFLTLSILYIYLNFKKTIMIKKLLLLTLLIANVKQNKAQCTISSGCSTSLMGYCSIPTSSTSIPNASYLAPYSTIIQLSLGTSFMVGPGSFISIISGTLNSITGLPSGLSYTMNPISNVLLGGSNGCVQISGTPATVGIYTLTGTLSAKLVGGGNIVYNPTWYLSVESSSATSINSISDNTSFLISPNPVSNELQISSESNFDKIYIVDALGKVLISKESINTSKTSIDLGYLNTGLYFIHIITGTKLIVKKIIKN